MLGDRLPSDSKRSKVVVPAVGAFDHPAPSSPPLAAARRFSAPTQMRRDATFAHLLFGVGVVVSLVEAEILRSTWSARCLDRHSIERLAGHPLVVNVCARQCHRDRNATPVGENMSFRSKLSTIGWIGPRESPPLGALTEALSSEAQHPCRSPLAEPPVARAAAAEFRRNRIPLTTCAQAIQDAAHRPAISHARTATLRALATLRNPNLNPFPKLVGDLGK